MTPEQFRAATDVSRETLSRLEAFTDLLIHWQRRINLIGRNDLDDLWRRHMLDSAQLAAQIPDDARILTDFGSGAGFPAMVLAIMLGAETHVIEANGRKCTFLREAARATGAPVQVHHGRIEAMAPWPTDVITARALAPLGKLLDYAEPFLRISHSRDPICLFLKGAKAQQELTDARQQWHMEVEPVASTSDASGSILRIRGISRE
jgi:16S rRNA (guanine527-N7)-methyltransferase